MKTSAVNGKRRRIGGRLRHGFLVAFHSQSAPHWCYTVTMIWRRPSTAHCSIGVSKEPRKTIRTIVKDMFCRSWCVGLSLLERRTSNNDHYAFPLFRRVVAAQNDAVLRRIA